MRHDRRREQWKFFIPAAPVWMFTKPTVVACVRVAADGAVHSEVRSFDTTTPGLLTLAD